MISYIKILLQEINKVSRLIELRGIKLYQFRGIIKRIICFKGYPKLLSSLFVIGKSTKYTHTHTHTRDSIVK